MIGLVLALAVALPIHREAQTPQADSSLVLTAVRFYRADPGQSPGQTHVTAFIQIPTELPHPGGEGEVSLRLAIRVVDGGGRVLYQQAWQKRTAVPAPRGAADRLDFLRFTLSAGVYRLEASAVDSVSGKRAEASLAIEAYSAPPAASDLMLSPWVRPVAGADTVPQPGEFRRGGLVLAIAPNVVVGGSTASLAYLFETYAGTAIDGMLSLTVVDQSGAVKKRIGATPVRIAAGIGLMTGQISVGDLGPGQFRLRAGLALGGEEQPVVREALFTIDPIAASSPTALPDQAYFERLGGAMLDQAFDPLRALAPARELAGWPAKGSDGDKRAFLTDFWSKRDPTPQVPGNERRAQFYDGVVYANAFYGEPRRNLAGWQSDRGRIFLRAGLPIQVLRREQRGTVPAYEVWRYFERVPRYYVFVERPAIGAYQLVRSNDPGEPRERRWQEILTPTGLKEVVAFLGREVLQ